MDPSQQLEVANCIFREANDAFFIFRPEDHRLIDVNPAGLRLTGYRRKELLGLTLSELLAAEAEDSIDSLVRAYEETSLFHAQDGYSLRHKDGARIPINVSASRIHTQDAPLGLVVVRDISERKQAEVERRRLESQLHQDQRLESLGIMAGGVAHDFNNLLTGILGHAELTLAKLDESSPFYSNLSMVRSSARRAAELTRQMLAFAGKGDFDFEPVDVTLLAKEMGELLRASVPRKIAFRFDTIDALPCVDADATQLRQVLMNLITNAADAIGDAAGVITVKTDAIELDPADFAGATVGVPLRRGPYVRVEVSDDGCGMESDVASKIFEPFFTTKFTGRGLGMASVLGIIRGHSGAISVSSEVGSGSSFTVFLPAIDSASEEEASPPTVSAHVRDHGTVLVIDDEPPVRDVVRSMLEGVGYDVLLAENGREGLEVFRKKRNQVDLVLLDLTMPEMDGRDFLRTLRSQGVDTPVILSSGYVLGEARDAWLEEETDAFIQKPFGPMELIDTVRYVLQTRAR